MTDPCPVGRRRAAEVGEGASTHWGPLASELLVLWPHIEDRPATIPRPSIPAFMLHTHANQPLLRSLASPAYAVSTLISITWHRLSCRRVDSRHSQGSRWHPLRVFGERDICRFRRILRVCPGNSQPVSPGATSRQPDGGQTRAAWASGCVSFGGADAVASLSLAALEIGFTTHHHPSARKA